MWKQTKTLWWENTLLGEVCLSAWGQLFECIMGIIGLQIKPLHCPDQSTSRKKRRNELNWNLDKSISLAVKLCPLGKECDYIELLCCTASPNWAWGQKINTSDYKGMFLANGMIMCLVNSHPTIAPGPQWLFLLKGTLHGLDRGHLLTR